MDKQKIWKANRNAYIAEAAFEYFMALLLTGAFLATLLTSIGLSDSLIGIMTSIASFSTLAQLLAIMVIKPKGRVKKIVTMLHLINEIMFIILYVIPVINIGKGAKTIIFCILFLSSQFIASSAQPFKSNWLMSFVNKNEMGMFTTVKEIISLIGGTAFTYIMGAVVDYFKETGNTNMGFIVCALTITALTVLHFISLVVVKDTEPVEIKEKKKTNLKGMLKNSTVLKIMIVNMFYSMGGMATSFLGTYQINELGFSLKYIAFLSALLMVVRVVIARFMGKYADRNSAAKLIVLSFFIGSIASFVNVFTVPSNGYIIFPLYYILFAGFSGGIGMGTYILPFEYLEGEECVSAIGFKNAISGLFGFGATLVGAKIVSVVQTNGNIVFGHTIYAQQILFFISAIIYLTGALYTNFVVCRLKVKR